MKNNTRTKIDRVLIVHASRSGSTKEAADVISRELRKRLMRVDVREAEEAGPVDGYDAVIVGSAVRLGSWLPSAVRFVELQTPALRAMPTAFFTIHVQNTGDDERSRRRRSTYLNAVHRTMHGTVEVFFDGSLARAKPSWFDTFIATLVRAKLQDKGEWPQVRSRAKHVFAPGRPQKARRFAAARPVPRSHSTAA